MSRNESTGGVMRRRSLGVLLLAVLICAASPQDRSDRRPTSFDPKLWLEDFHQILSEMSSHYANLDWAVDDRKMDLHRLRLDTEAKIRAATDESEARRILEKFIASFGDGHLVIEWPKSAAEPTAALATSHDLCERLGYKARLHPGMDFSGLPNFSALNSPEAKLFPGGLLRLRNGTVIGIIRMSDFSEHSHPEICKQAVRDLHVAEDTNCDDKCDDQIQLATANLLTSALVRRTETLRAAGATTLLIDITHNGGGSDWVEAAARALSPFPLRDSKMAFIKHDHWTTQLQNRLRDVQADITNHANSPVSLDAAAHTLEKAINESKAPCDTSTVWETGKVNCSLLVKDLLYASGMVPYAKPENLASLQSKTVLFQPSRYAYSENSGRLPLYVVVDRDTWSAAEYFAALFQDNHAAAVFGEVTGGAGCGYTNGGVPANLKNSAARLKMPDCVRLRADGSDEVNGVTPDVLLPWARQDSDFQRLEKLVSALEARQPARPSPSQ